MDNDTTIKLIERLIAEAPTPKHARELSVLPRVDITDAARRFYADRGQEQWTYGSDMGNVVPSEVELWLEFDAPAITNTEGDRAMWGSIFGAERQRGAIARFHTPVEHQQWRMLQGGFDILDIEERHRGYVVLEIFAANAVGETQWPEVALALRVDEQGAPDKLEVIFGPDVAAAEQDDIARRHAVAGLPFVFALGERNRAN